MKHWDAKDWVAVTLAACLLFPFLALGITDVVSSFQGRSISTEQGNVEITKVIGDLMKVIAGGLIGWIAGRTNGNREG